MKIILNKIILFITLEYFKIYFKRRDWGPYGPSLPPKYTINLSFLKPAIVFVPSQNIAYRSFRPFSVTFHSITVFMDDHVNVFDVHG
jgi:hypothetical protein